MNKTQVKKIALIAAVALVAPAVYKKVRQKVPALPAL